MYNYTDLFNIWEPVYGNEVISNMRGELKSFWNS